MYFLAFLLIILILLVGYIALKLRSRFSHLDAKIERIAEKSNEYIIKKIVKNVSRKSDESAQEVQNAIALTSLRFSFPVFTDYWSIDPFLGRFLVQHLIENRPKTIVELGSGTSTLIIGKTLKLLEEKKVDHIAVDHESKYLELTALLGKLNEVNQNVKYWHCPLGKIEGVDEIWFSDFINKLSHINNIDLLIVDSPPGPIQPHSRYPALKLVYPYLAKKCTVILDDALRPDEQEIANRWAKEFPEFQLNIIKMGHGIAILTR